MRNKLDISSVDYDLDNDEFKTMIEMRGKGIICVKAKANDNITELALLLPSLFSAQSRFTKDKQRQSNMLTYGKADALAAKCIELLKPFVVELESKKPKKAKKPKKTQQKNISEQLPEVDKQPTEKIEGFETAEEAEERLIRTFGDSNEQN